jgi:hypothetical protein
MSRESHPNPRRLAEGDDAAGRALHAGADAFGGGLDETRAFRRLERARRRRSRASFAVVALAAALGLAVLSLRAQTPSENERLTRETIAVPEVAPRAPAPAPPTPPSHAAASAFVALPSPAASSVRAEVAPPNESRCRELVKNGQAERGFDCFRSLSRGNGLLSEVALYEAARVSFEHLADARRSLELLREYELRHPEGALRGEADWLRVRSLRGAGRFEQALVASEVLLTTPAGRTLADDIHFLRGVLFDDELNDCARAVSEFVSLVGKAGARADEAELRRARCLEKLGRANDAREAFQRYLERPAAANAEEARAKLQGHRDLGHAETGPD